MKKKLKIIHIHTDYKFIWSSLSSFEGNFFDNTVVILEKKVPYKGLRKKNTLIFNFSDKQKCLTAVIDSCSTADLVILYDLDFMKSMIACALPKNKKVAWRFFGYELYSKRTDIFLSNKSLLASKSKYPNIINHSFKIIKNIYHLIKHRGTPSSMFNAAVNRIDYFFALSQEEYDLLCIYWSNLPEFLKLPNGKFDIDIEALSSNFNGKVGNRSVIIGNNRSSYNNHLEVIDIIDKNPNKLNYNFQLLFNYGDNGIYQEKVRRVVKKKEYIILIEDFIASEEFNVFYQKIIALVINGYRQMAVGNIMLALKNGVKVYLNKRNAHLNFLQNEGFYIFTMEDFENDLTNDNLFLDYETAKKNLIQLNLLSKKYNISDFQNSLYGKLTQK
jgi:hypothetical protein